VKELSSLKTVFVVFVFCAATAIASPAQVLTTLHSFDGPDGANPVGLIQATDGNFYGTTYLGGANGYGTVFGMYPNGTLGGLYSFGGSDGGIPGPG
jgi:hypothetical protein